MPPSPCPSPRRLLAAVGVALVGVACGLGVVAATWRWTHLRPRPPRSSSSTERWVNANHLQVVVRGTWQDVALMPLAAHLCRGRQPLFERYCDDPPGASRR